MWVRCCSCGTLVNGRQVDITINVHRPRRMFCWIQRLSRPIAAVSQGHRVLGDVPCFTVRSFHWWGVVPGIMASEVGGLISAVTAFILKRGVGPSTTPHRSCKAQIPACSSTLPPSGSDTAHHHIWAMHQTLRGRPCMII